MNRLLVNTLSPRPRKSVGILLAATLLIGAGLQACGGQAGPPPQAQQLLEEGQQAYYKTYVADAARCWRQAVALDSTFAEAWLWLGRAEGYFMKFDESRNSLAQAQRHVRNLGPRDRLILDILLADQAGQELEVAGGVDRPVTEFGKDADALSFAGPRLFYSRDYPRTLEIYRTLLELAPERGEAYNMMGYAYAALEQFDDALDSFQKYAFIYPEQPNPHDSLGELYLRTGRYEEALQEFRRAADAKHDFVWAYQHQAMTLEETGRFSEARNICLESMGGPDNGISPDSWRHFAISILIEAERWDEALESFRASLADGDDSHTIHFHGTRIQARMGNPAAAREEYQRYLSSYELHVAGGEVDEDRAADSFGAHYLAGLIALAEDRWDEAADHFAGAAEKGLGWQFARMANTARLEATLGGGHPGQAAKLARTILKVNPREPRVNFLMGEALEALGDHGAALRHFHVAASVLAQADEDHPLLAPLRERLDELALATGS